MNFLFDAGNHSKCVHFGLSLMQLCEGVYTYVRIGQVCACQQQCWNVVVGNFFCYFQFVYVQTTMSVGLDPLDAVRGVGIGRNGPLDHSDDETAVRSGVPPRRLSDAGFLLILLYQE